MRKIMMVAALATMTFGYAVHAQSQGLPVLQGQEVQGLDSNVGKKPQQGEGVIPQGPLLSKRVMLADTIHIIDVILEEHCDIRVYVHDKRINQQLVFVGDETDPRGHLKLESIGYDVARPNGRFGKYAFVGDIGLLLEVSDGAGRGKMILYKRVNPQAARGGLIKISDEMPTDGLFLARYDRAIRTYAMTATDLQMIYMNNRGDALAFLAELAASYGQPRDAVVAPTAAECVGPNCRPIVRPHYKDRVRIFAPNGGRAGYPPGVWE